MNSNTKSNEYMIDSRQLVSTIWQRRWWVIGSVVLFTTIFTTIAFVMTPIYSASTVVIPATAGRNSSSALGSMLGQFGGLASLAGVSLGSDDSDTTEALAILRSREFVDKFIADKNLMPELFADKWDAVNGKWKVSEQKQPTSAKAYKFFTKEVFSVSQDKKTSLVTIKIDWSDRFKAAQWANELVGRINETMRLRAVENADASIGYLEKELKNTNVVATQEAINRLIEAQVKQRMLANVAPEYMFRVVDRALPVDESDRVRPQRVVLIIIGLVFGGGLGFLLATSQTFYRRTDS